MTGKYTSRQPKDRSKQLVQLQAGVACKTITDQNRQQTEIPQFINETEGKREGAGQRGKGGRERENSELETQNFITQGLRF